MIMRWRKKKHEVEEVDSWIEEMDLSLGQQINDHS